MPMSSAARDHEPAGDEPRVLPRLDHAREVVQRGVDVGAADRLDERADDVVVLVALAVVAQQRAIDGLRDELGGDRRACPSAFVSIARWPRARRPRAP